MKIALAFALASLLSLCVVATAKVEPWVCQLAPFTGGPEPIITDYYFDARLGRCFQYEHTYFAHTANNFKTLEECNENCPSLCSLPYDGGYGDRPIDAPWMYYYDPGLGYCSLLRYRGKGGNANRFETFEQCEQTCVPPQYRRKFQAAASTLARIVA